MIRKISYILTLHLLVFAGYKAKAQYDTTITTTGATVVWTVPTNTCITEYTFEAWGGGADGLTTVTSDRGAAGGGAGGYARTTVTGVTPGQTFTISVGAKEQDSWVKNPANVTILTAEGATGQAGASGTIAIGTNTFVTTGGSGAAQANNGNNAGGGSNDPWSGGGGGGAGGDGIAGDTPVSTGGWASGVDAKWSSGGAGRGGGGAGGRSAYEGNYCPSPAAGVAALDGSAPGGGGGGGGRDHNGDAVASGNGAQGAIRISANDNVKYTIAGTQTWSCPAGIEKAVVTVWGAGGEGGGNATANNGSSGGGGGGFAQSVIDVTGGNTYTLVVGAGGSGGADDGNDGGESWFSNRGDGTVPTAATEGARAAGGTGGENSATLGTGGAGLIGQYLRSGGNGGARNGSNWSSGGGGGAAGSIGGNGGVGEDGDATANCSQTESAGGTANTTGLAKYTGADGSYSGRSASTIARADQPGGGGGGSGESQPSGGDGGDGMVFIEWPPIANLILDELSTGVQGYVEDSNHVAVNTTNTLIHSFPLSGFNFDPCEPIVITGYQFTTTGTYLASDVSNFKLYTTTTNTFTPTTLVATIAAPAVAGTQTFPAFTLNVNAKMYVWVTMDISASASDCRTIAVQGSSSSDFTSDYLFSNTTSSATSGTQTFGCYAPGGVLDNLELWLKADEEVTGTSPVTGWADQSSSSNDVTTVGGTPVLGATNVNFNPSITLDGVNEYFTGAFSIQSNTSTVYTVGKMATYATTGEAYEGMFSAQSSDQANDHDNVSSYIYLLRGNTDDDMDSYGNSTQYSGAASSVDNAYHIYGSEMDATNVELFFDGKAAGTTAHTQTMSAENYYVGARYITNAAATFMTGDVAEVIQYEQALSAADQQKVDTYLAIKYGITLDDSGGGTAGDYVDTDGTILWDADNATVTTYHNDITGLGRDDAEQLSQIKSKSENSDAILTVWAHGEGTSNAIGDITWSNMADKEYFIWGNDGAVATFTCTNAPDGYNKITRTWYVKESSDVGACTFTFDVNDADFDVPALPTGATNYVLLYDSDVNLDGGSTITLYDDGATAGDAVNNDGIWTNNTVNLADGTFFSIGCSNVRLASASPAAAAATVCASSTKNPIYAFNLTPTNAPNLTALNFTTTGTFAQADISKYQLWYNDGTDDINDGGTVQISTDLTPTGGATTVESFAAFSQALSCGSTSYFWITADVAAAPTTGNLLTVSAITTNSLTVSDGTKTGSTSAGGLQTISYPALSSSLTPADICDGAAFTYTATSVSPSPTFAWSRATIAGITEAGVTSTGNVSETLSNTTNSPIDVTYIYTTTSGGCNGPAQNVIVSVNPTPTLSSSTATSTICSGISFTYTPTGNVGGSTFTWARSANANISEATTTGVTGINETLTNTSASNTNVTYVYTTTANGCSNDENIEALVRPNPQGSFTGNTRCAGNAGSFGQLTWTATAGTGPFVVDTTASQAGVTSGVAYSLPVSTPTVTSVYALSKVTDTYGCERTTGFTAGTATITVTGAAIAYTNGTPASATTCAGTALTYTVTASNVNTYTWEVSTDGGTVYNAIAAAGAGPVYSNYNTAELTVSNATVAHSGYKYRAVLTPACGPDVTSDVADLTVNVLPVLSSATGAGAAGAACSGSAVTYTATSGTGGTTFAWSRTGQAGITEATSTGTGNINETLTNTTTAPIVVTYNYVSTALGCNDPAGEDVLATVNPIPNLSSTTSPSDICSGTTFTYTATSATAGATFAWSRATIAGITEAGVTTTGNVSETLTNSTTAPIDVTYIYTTTANSCSNTGENVIVTVNPTPNLSSTTSPSDICSGTTFTYTATSATAGATFAWRRAAIVGITEAGATTTGNVSETLTNTTTAPIDVTYIYTTTANSCSNTGENVIVTVNPIPNLSSTTSPGDVCSGTTFTYTATSATAGATFAWSRALVAGITEAGVTTTGNVSETLTNSTTAPIDVTYIYTTTANSCSNTGENVIVTVNPTPNLSSTTNPADICSATTFTYTATSATAGATFAWSRAAIVGITEAGATTTGNVSETLTNTTTAPIDVTYIYTTTANSCSNTGENVIVTVNPIPNLSSTTNPADICSGTTYTYTATSATAGATFAWSRAAIVGITEAGATTTGNVSETLTNPTTSPIDVTYIYTTTANSCSNTGENVIVTVNPIPSVSSTTFPSDICSGTTFTYTATSATAGATFAWSRAAIVGITEAGATTTGNVSETLTNTTTAPIDVTYIYTTTANSCNNNGEDVIVTVNPTPNLSSTTNPADICAGTTFTYTATSATAGSTFTWSRATVANITEAGSTGTGNVSETLTNTSSSASIDVTYVYTTTANSCSNSGENVIVTIHPTPTLSSSTNPSTICSGTSFTYTPTGNVAGSTFTWARSANADITEATTTGTGGVNEVLTSTNANNINVTYVYTSTANNCSNDENVIPVIRPNPQGSFTGNTRCAGDAGSFGQLTWTATAGTGPFVVDTTASQVGVNSGVPYSLPVSTPTVTSVYALSKVTDAFGCERTTGFTAGTATVTVTGAAISYTNGTPASATTCSGTAVTFTVTASNVNGYTWEVSTDGGGVYNPINAAGAGPIYSNYNTAELTVSNPTVAHSGYKYRSVMIPACGPNITSDVADLTVNVLPVLSSATGAGAAGTVCSGVGAVTYTPTSVTPGTTFAWTRLGQAGITEASSTGTGNINETLTNTTTSPTVVTYNYVSTALGCNDPAGEDVLVTINPDANLVLTSAVGTDNQTVCKGDAITDVTYTFNEGATSYTITGLPTGVAHVAATNTITIFGTPSVDGVYNYTVQTTGSCNQTQAVGTITSGASLSSAAGTDNQVVCKNTAITPITYAVGSSNATVTPLPAGVTGNYAGNVFTISGTPAVEGSFGYTVSTPGTCTTPTDLTGVITVGIGPITPGSDDQTVCEGDPITPIQFSYAGLGTPTVGGLPAGLSAAVNGTNDTLTISGTPSAAGAFNYTITTLGACASESTIYGDLAVGIGVVTPGADDQTVCEGDLITPIVYSYAGGGVISVAGLPTGLTTSTNVTKDTLIITGTPIVSGSYDYTIVTTAGSCSSGSSFVGSITVGVGVTTLGTDDQTVCDGDLITPIVYSYAGGGNATVTGLPTGLSALQNVTNDTITISGTPTVSGAVDYTVTTTAGTCGSGSSFVGSITVGVGVTTLGTDDQTVCDGDLITPIVYSYAGGGNATVAGLPAGLSAVQNVTNDTITITGTPTVSGAVDYTVTTTAGTCGSGSSFVGALTVGVGVTTLGTDDQTVCDGDLITPIVYSYAGGGNASVTGLPTGLSALQNATNDTITISGTPTVSGSSDYTVTTTAGTCGSGSSFVGSLTVGVGVTALGTDDQTVCDGDLITPIVYSYAGGGNATVTGLPTGLNAVQNATNDTITISGTPTVSGAVDYTVTTTAGTCGSGSSFVGVLTVGVGVTTLGTDDQTVCDGDLITPIVYSYAGGGNATVTGLPTGLNAVQNATNDTIIISGTPTVSGAVDYTVTTTAGTCGSGSSFVGSITVGVGVITLGTDDQTVCDGDLITPIVYSYAGGGNASVTGLPTGLNAVQNATNDTITISGTPTISGSSDYTVTTTAGTCGNGSSFVGSITVGVGVTTLGTDDQTVCDGDLITPIVYSYAGGGNASVTGLPTGLNAVQNATNDTITISGTPTISGSSDYTVTTTAGTCGNGSSFVGSITVGVGVTTLGTDDQTVCQGDPITPIVYSYAGGGNATVAGLPAGLTQTQSITNDTLIISGIPTVSGSSDYTVITTQGTCGSGSSFVGSLTVGVGVVTAGADDQAVCQGDPIIPIQYAYAGGGNANVTGLPTGLSALQNVTNDTITISGTPTVSGTSDYTVTITAGTCGNGSSFVGSVTVGVGVVTLGSDVQEVCEGEAINDIVYVYAGGGNATVSGLPAGLNFAQNITNDTVTISGIPTASGTFNYVVITTAGSCGAGSNFAGVITVGINNAVGGSTTQTVCINEPITDIIYPLPGLVTGVNATGLPNGVTGTPSLNQYTIAGTPTVAGVFNYSVTTSSAVCNNPSILTGTITVNQDTITHTGIADTMQTLCINQPIDSLFYSISGTAGSLSLSPTNQGLKMDALGGGTYVVSGTPPPVNAVNNYVVTSTSTGCTTTGAVTQSITIVVLKPEANFVMDNDKGVAPITVNFTNSSNFADTYAWSFASPTDTVTSTDTDPSHIFDKSTFYTVQLIASANNQCHDTISYPIQTFSITLPNVFTPNEDGYNDVFKIKDDGLSDLSATIYDRWGKKVGELVGVNDSWDGNGISTGVPCSEGTYFVVLETEDFTGVITQYSFTLELKR